MADLRRNSGLKTEVVDQILQLFPELSDLTPGNKANPPLNEWGSDDWLAFINEYTKGEKISAYKSISIEVLKRDLSGSIKQSSHGDGRFGLEAAQIRIRPRQEARAAAERERATWAAPAGAGETGVGAPAGVGQAGVGAPAGVGQVAKAEITSANKIMKKISENVPMSQNATKKSSGNVPMSQNATKKSSNVPMGVPGQVAQGPMPVMAQGYEGQGVMSTTEKEAQKQATRNMRAEQGMLMAQGMQISGKKNTTSEASTGGPPMDITPLVTALSTINNTLISSLASIETRAKNTDINPALTKMNNLLSQINSSLPDPTHGGGDNDEVVEVKKEVMAAKKKEVMAAKKKKKGKSKKKGKPKSAAVPGEMPRIPAKSAEVPGTIGGVITVLSQINTTLQTSLAAIETRLKLNDVNPALIRMNDFLSQINDSLPEQAGGGTRRSRVKKRTETLRHRRT